MPSNKSTIHNQISQRCSVCTDPAALRQQSDAEQLPGSSVGTEHILQLLRALSFPESIFRSSWVTQSKANI